MERTFLETKLGFKTGALLKERYEVLEILGKGSSGVVVTAFDREVTDRVVCLKILHAALVSEAAAIERFKREVLIARQLSHPNIVRVYDIIIDAPVYALSMEYVEGCNLRELQMAAIDKRVPFHEVLHILSQILEGLHFSHRHKVIHRDLKPENILIDRAATVKITDFGIARFSETSFGLTKTGEFLGTPSYMSPEQLLGGELTVASDLYSFGIIAYELVCGTTPFPDVSVAELINGRKDDIVDYSLLSASGAPAWFVEMISSCLGVDPKSRPNSARTIISLIESKRSGIKKVRNSVIEQALLSKKEHPDALLQTKAIVLGRLAWFIFLLVLGLSVFYDRNARSRIGTDLLNLQKEFSIDLTSFYSLADYGEFKPIDSSRVFESIFDDEYEKFQMYLRSTYDLDILNAEGESLIVKTVKIKSSYLYYLLQHGANPDFIDRNGDTALCEAIRRSSNEHVQYLLGFGADPLKKNGKGEIPYLLAIGIGHEETVDLILNKVDAEKVVVTDERGFSALHLAVQNSDPNVVLKLLTDGAVPDVRHPGNGVTPLMLVVSQAATAVNKEIATHLLAHGAQISAHDNSGKSVLDHISSEFERAWQEILEGN